MKITTIGIDLAKNVFQVHGVDERGRTVSSALDPKQTLNSHIDVTRRKLICGIGRTVTALTG